MDTAGPDGFVGKLKKRPCPQAPQDTWISLAKTVLDLPTVSHSLCCCFFVVKNSKNN